jgi:hypothetical protein
MKYQVLFQVAKGFIVDILKSLKKVDENKNQIPNTRGSDEAQMHLKESHKELLSKCQNEFKESEEKIDSHRRSIAFFKARILHEKRKTSSPYKEYLLIPSQLLSNK